MADNAKNALVTELTRIGADKILASYSGEGDGGGVDRVRIFQGENPLTLDVPTRELVEELLWDFIAGRHPGFERGRGAEGKVAGEGPAWAFVNEHYPYDTEDDEITDD